MPSFNMTPARITEPAVGAWVWASGSHVCSGNSGTLTANATAKPRNSQRSVDCASDWEVAIRTRSNVTWPPLCCAFSTTSTIIATSMNAEPNIVYRKNFVAAYLRSA